MIKSKIEARERALELAIEWRKALPDSCGTTMNMAKELGDIYEKLDEMHSLMYTLQPDTDLDWDKVRVSAAISAMNGLLSSERNKLLNWDMDWCVEQSVKYADKLINELRNKNNGQ